MAVQTAQSLSDPTFRHDLRQMMRFKKKDAKDWSHQELCFKHRFGTILTKRFSTTLLPPHITDFCICDSTKETIRTEYDSIYRISLFDALSSYSYKPKPALLAEFSLTVDGTKHNIDIMKLRTNSLKRYTQPGTNTTLIGTAAFHDRCLFWKLDDEYYVEFRLKRRYVVKHVDTDSNRENLDCAKWWYQCFCVYGIKEYEEKQEKQTNSTNVMQSGIRLKPYIAVHNNNLVGDLKKNLKRIVVILHRKKGQNMEQNTTKIQINGVHHDISKKKKESKKRKWNEVQSIKQEIKPEVDSTIGFARFASSANASSHGMNREYSENIKIPPKNEEIISFQDELYQESKTECIPSMKEEERREDAVSMETALRLKAKIKTMRREKNQYKLMYEQRCGEHERFRHYVYETTHKMQYAAMVRDREIHALLKQNQALREKVELLSRQNRYHSLLNNKDVSALTPLFEMDEIMHYQPPMKRQKVDHI